VTSEAAITAASASAYDLFIVFPHSFDFCAAIKKDSYCSQMCNKSLAKAEALSVRQLAAALMAKRTLTAGAVKKLLPFINIILPLK
jgi:hypothetical protein